MTATAEAVRRPKAGRAFYTPQEVSMMTGTTYPIIDVYTAPADTTETSAESYDV